MYLSQWHSNNHVSHYLALRISGAACVELVLLELKRSANGFLCGEDGDEAYAKVGQGRELARPIDEWSMDSLSGGVVWMN
jgi:hypothetical protein